MKQKGLTLVELLISSSIAVVVGGLLLTIILNSAGLFYKESSKVDIGLNTNDGLAQVRKSIKESNKVIPTFTDGSVIYTSGVSQLVLQIPSIDQSGNIIPATFDNFVFFLDQTKLLFKTFPNALSSRKAQNQIFSTNVQSLVFQYLNSASPPVEVTPISATKVRTTLTLKEKSGADYETNIATSEANLRNN